MALWGKDDNLRSAGTVVVDYAAKTVTGTGTTFTDSAVGDVIRFGVRGGGGVYFGDAVISEITNDTNCKIASTEALNGSAISGAAYYLSQLPLYTTEDHEWSEKKNTSGEYYTFKSRDALEAIGIGNSIIAVDTRHLGLQLTANHPDVIVNNSARVNIAGVGTGTKVALSPSIVGHKKVYITPVPPGVAKGSYVVNGGKNIHITGTASTYVSLQSGVTAQIDIGNHVEFGSRNMISLTSTIAAAIEVGDHIDFQRLSGGYDRVVYGIGNGHHTIHENSSTPYRTENTGWVGVTTYIDCDGNFRVKKETLVAMSGITTTGDFGSQGIVYPTAE